ncbi:hypothetical protein ABZ281_31930 [Streptomyces sp. NPDC006265]|uniref:hypothetical protein n=1 Tax=Streptomyces sp. NPDC006265 TaxID=3156740 RepID=UPI0033BB51DF
MGSQDQHHENEPQTATEALERAAALTQQADTADREAGRYASHDLREQISTLKTRAADLRKQERKQQSKRDAVAIGAHRKVFQAQHTAGADVPDLDDLLGGDAA